MIRFIYNLLWPLGLIFFLPGYLVKMFRRGGYRKKFGQRLGIYEPQLGARLYWQKPIWWKRKCGPISSPKRMTKKFRSFSLTRVCRRDRKNDFECFAILFRRFSKCSTPFAFKILKMSRDGTRSDLKRTKFIMSEASN